MNSWWVAETLKKDLGIDCGQFIPIGVDTDLFYERGLRAANQPVKVLAFHRPSTPRRGDDLLATTFEALHKRFGAKVDLATYGNAPMQGIEFPVTHLGLLAQSDLATLMARADVLLEPSDVQGWGMPGQEAMTSGCCLVSTANGGIDNYGTTGVNCLIGDGEREFVSAAIQAVESGELRRKLGLLRS